MATFFTVRCNSCNHTKETSRGPSRTMLAGFEPMVCQSCEDVVHVTTEYFDHFGSQENKDEIEASIGKCPICNGKDLVEWDGSKCPKCTSGTMEVDPNKPIVNAD